MDWQRIWLRFRRIWTHVAQILSAPYSNRPMPALSRRTRHRPKTRVTYRDRDLEG
jgi:hypothetical protein